MGSDPETGKRRQQWHTVRGIKKDAERALRELPQSIETGNYVKPHRLTVGEWLEQWIESYVVLHDSPRTVENYRSIIRRHLRPALGALLLTGLRPQHLQGYYAGALRQGRADGRGGLSAASVLRQHRVISRALSDAVKQGLVARNVAKACEPPRAARTRMAVMAEEDVPRFLAAARQTPYYVLFYTALYTGLRRGELLGLRWVDLDLDLAFLSVVQTLQRVTGAILIKEPKSPYSRRRVSLPPSLALLLREHQVKQQAQWAVLGKLLKDDDLVFAQPGGAPLGPHTVTHEFALLLKRAGLPHIRFHDLRHTHATLMLKAGVHPKVVSERLGHASVAITLDTYSHVAPGLQEAAAQRFDRMLELPDVSKTLAEAIEPDTRNTSLEAACISPGGRELE